MRARVRTGFARDLHGICTGTHGYGFARPCARTGKITLARENMAVTTQGTGCMAMPAASAPENKSKKAEEMVLRGKLANFATLLT